MSYINKTVSVKAIIAKVKRTFRPTGGGWINDAVEDIGWAIQAIGYHAGFEKKQTAPPYLKVANFRTKLPCDVERIIAVEQLLPDGRNIDRLNPDGTTPYPLNEYDSSCNYKGVKMLLGSDQTGYGLSSDTERTTEISPGAPYYNLNIDYIITSFEQGLIKLHYIGFALDKEGLPRVLDDADYKMALEWYVFYNMILRGYKHPEVTWKEAFQMWESYKLKAENACKIPSIDGAERFRNSWTRFSVGSEWSKDFFMNLEQPTFIE